MTDTKPTMNTDKVLALAKEAGLAVTISSHDSLHKFAALLQREIGADAKLAALVEAEQVLGCYIIDPVIETELREALAKLEKP